MRLLKNIKLNKCTGIYVILVFAILNACLRLSESGATSLFRLVAPIMIFVILIKRYKNLKKELIIVAVAFAYSTVVSVAFYKHISFDMWIFGAYLVATYIFVKYVYLTDSHFEVNFWKFLDAVTIISLILCWIQFFVRIPYPYLTLARDPGVNIFMSNENEIGAPLACMLLLYVYKLLFEKGKKYIFIIVNILFFLFINDAKLAIIGVVVGIALYLIFIAYTSKFLNLRISAGVFSVAFISVCLMFIVLISVLNPVITFRDYDISLRELLLDEILDILTLNPTYGSGGSLVDRTNAIIFGLIELKNTFFFGIGWGNSIEMLAKPEYMLLTAKSMHNLVFQFLVEFGIFAIFVYWKILKSIFKWIGNANQQNRAILKIVFAIAFIFISSQSSVGILSNYYTWIIVFYIYLLPTKDNESSEVLCG